jgi:predicted TIM-barrel fold metal-dependent hydrolase
VQSSIGGVGLENTGRRSERVVGTFLPEPVPAELWCPMISVDDHVLEPRTLFENRIPKALADSAPRCVDDADGAPHWDFEDQHLGILFGNGRSGRPYRDTTLAPQFYEDFRRGVWDIDSRVKDMDVNGIYASLCFPSIVFGFAGTRFNKMHDQKLGLACLRAYNDWMLEEWCGAYPERFIPCQIPWMADPLIGADEVLKNAARGFKSVSFSENPEMLGFTHLYGDHWDPFFKACEDTETVVNLHVGSSGTMCRPSSHSPIDVGFSLFPINGLEAIVDWIFAKIPIKFPRIKIVLSEAGVSWVPMIIERLKRAYRFREGSSAWDGVDIEPVELLHRNFWFTSIEDTSAFTQLDIIGENKVMVESDYPHSDSSWPETQSLFRRDMGHLNTGTIKKICYENASALYRHPMPPEDLIRSSTVGRLAIR